MADDLIPSGDLHEPVIEPASTNDDIRSIIIAARDKQVAERTAAAAPAAEPTAEPAETPEAKAERARAPDGKFIEAPKDAKEAAPAKDVAKAEPKPDAAPAASEVAPAPTEHKPPVGWSAASKAKFATLPPEIQADVAKRETEINQGFAKLADYKGIDRFADQAKQSGKTLETVLTSYTSMENKLRTRPLDGLIELCQNIGIDPRVAGQALMGQAPSAQPAGQQPPADAMQQLPPALLQELFGVKQTVAQLQQERAEAHRTALEQRINAFYSDPKHKYAEQVTDQMLNHINVAQKTGTPIDIDAIYEQAIWQHPEVREELIKERAAALAPPATPVPPVNPQAKAAAAATQAKQAAKAITGAPARNAPAGNAPSPNQSLRETIQSAVEQQRGV